MTETTGIEKDKPTEIEDQIETMAYIVLGTAALFVIGLTVALIWLC